MGMGSAVCLSFSRFGGVVAFNLAPLIAARVSLRATLLFGFG